MGKKSKKSKFWTSDKLVAVVAIFISLMTLFIFVWQTNIIEKQSHLSVMPYLMIESSNNYANNVFKLELINYGVGPAIIESKVIKYKGNSFKMEFKDFLDSQFPLMDSIQATDVSSIQRGLAIPMGVSRTIIRVFNSKSDYNNFLVILNDLQSNGFYYEITYRSIYGQRWKITSLNEAPEEL